MIPVDQNTPLQAKKKTCGVFLYKSNPYIWCSIHMVKRIGMLFNTGVSECHFSRQKITWCILCTCIPAISCNAIASKETLQFNTGVLHMSLFKKKKLCGALCIHVLLLAREKVPLINNWCHQVLMYWFTISILCHTNILSKKNVFTKGHQHSVHILTTSKFGQKLIISLKMQLDICHYTHSDLINYRTSDLQNVVMLSN